MSYNQTKITINGCDDKRLFQAAQYGVPLLRPQESFSSVECKGYGDQILINNDTSTTCLFSNVLYKEGVLTLYYDDKDDFEYLTSNVQLNAIPEHFLAVRSGPIIAHESDTWLKIKVLPAEQFSEGIVYEKDKIHVLYDIFAPYNQGHFMFDEVFVVFQSLLEMGLHGLHPQTITLRSCNNGICSQIYKERWHSVTSKAVLSLEDGKTSESSTLQNRYRNQGIMF